MAIAPATKSPAVVLDACVVIGFCAKEHDKYAVAAAQLSAYAIAGWQMFAPGALISEVLYVFCKKIEEGSLDPADRSAVVADFVALASQIQPPPHGDASLIARADAIRGTYGCARASDAIYLALAEELRADRQTELATFDAKMENHARANSLDDILKILPVT